MSLIRDIRFKHDIQTGERFHVTPIECRRRRAGTDLEMFSTSAEVKEEIHVLVFLPERKEPTVAIYPGITGYEVYHVASVLTWLRKSRAEFVPKKGAFGMSNWEHMRWTLNAGSVKYDNLETSVGDLVEAMKWVGIDVDDLEDPTPEPKLG